MMSKYFVCGPVQSEHVKAWQVIGPGDKVIGEFASNKEATNFTEEMNNNE